MEYFNNKPNVFKNKVLGFKTIWAKKFWVYKKIKKGFELKTIWIKMVWAISIKKIWATKIKIIGLSISNKKA